MIPSYFKIEILTMRDEFVTQGHKGLKSNIISSKSLSKRIGLREVLKHIRVHALNVQLASINNRTVYIRKICA